MSQAAKNPNLLRYFAPFRIMAISGAYVVPFFVEKGLSQSEIFLLQSIFSVVYLLWEVPSGYIADKIGNALSMKLSVPFAVAGFVGYGLSDEFWQFVIFELLIAISSGFVSGADTALLYDSLKANGRQAQAGRFFQQIKAYGFAAVAVGAPLSMLVAHFWGLGATLIVDGLLIAAGSVFVLRLAEVKASDSHKEAVQSVWRSMWHLVQRPETRWLIVLTTALATATYVGAWLLPAFLQQVGVPLEYFAFIAAGRFAWKAAWGHFFHPRYTNRVMAVYIALVLVGSLAMVPGAVWFALLLLAYDIVHAVQDTPVMQRLNDAMASRYRATLNSVVSMFGRLSYTVIGPFVGLLADGFGLATALFVSGTGCATVAAFALWRVHCNTR